MKNRLNYIVLSILVSVYACSISSAQIVITPVNELNSSADDFATTLVKNSRKMYFSSDRRGQQQVFEVTRDKSGELSVEGRVRGDVNHSDQSGSVTLTPDGQTLYFVSDRSGGKGGTDIYVCTRTSEGWTKARNVSELNTGSDEMSPHIALDGSTFFFASNRSGSMGGFDIYFTKLSGNSFSSPKNAGKPINSASDELFYVDVQNTKHAYFTSNRPGGLGDLDIYHAVPNPHEANPVVFASGLVLDKETKEPIAAQVTITDLKTKKRIAKFTSDDETGDFLVTLKPGHTYSVTATAPNYFFYSEKLTIPENARGDEINKNIELSHNSTRLLVTFDFNKATLNDESIPDLENLLELLKDKSNMDCVLEGHTDDVGSDDFNMKLSKERADAVKTWLVNNGIKSSRIETKGYGESRPLIKETTEEARAMNRRVEIKLK